MRIGVISDTHLRFFEEIPREVVKVFSNVDLIVHAGDFTALEVLEGLRQLSEVKAVRGNMDSAELRSLLSDKELFVVGDKKIGVTHGTGAPWGVEHRIRDMFDDVDVIIYGHTHGARNEKIRGTLFFNPGRGNRSFGILTIEDGIKGEIIKL